MDPLDHFNGEYSQEQLVGTCNGCNETDIAVSLEGGL